MAYSFEEVEQISLRLIRDFLGVDGLCGRVCRHHLLGVVRVGEVYPIELNHYGVRYLGPVPWGFFL